jgi:hypothetical protein
MLTTLTLTRLIFGSAGFSYSFEMAGGTPTVNNSYIIKDQSWFMTEPFLSSIHLLRRKIWNQNNFKRQRMSLWRTPAFILVIISDRAAIGSQNN